MSDKKPLNIFIVDDDNEIIEVMTTLLQGAGHTVSSSVSGITAFSQILAAKPDCVLVDLMMSALDGLELCKEICARKALNRAALIIVSARQEEHWRERARDAGAADYISKPLDLESFAAQVEEIVAAALPRSGRTEDMPPVSL